MFFSDVNWQDAFDFRLLHWLGIHIGQIILQDSTKCDGNRLETDYKNLNILNLNFDFKWDKNLIFERKI